MMLLSNKEHIVKHRYLLIVAFVLLLASCARAETALAPAATLAAMPDNPTAVNTSTVQAKATATLTQTPKPTATAAPTLTFTPAYPPLGRGPTGFASGIDPFTGLEVANSDLLNRRPIVIKVENIPRAHRPQWGLTLADLVYEYYTEQGATRFAAVFYGNDAERVGPIRSGRFFDVNIVQMYKAIFIYGSAWTDVQKRFFDSDFSSRLILETLQSCPALCRYDPNGQNLLVANTAALPDYLKTRSVDNQPQNQDGMFFRMQVPNGGDPAAQVFLRYSGAIYNRWDYDAVTGRYLRFADKQDDVNRNNEVYEQLTDRLTNRPVTAENVVTLCVPHEYYIKSEEGEVIDIIMDNRVASYAGCDGKMYTGGSGPAYIARDGKMYAVTWRRAKPDSALTLVGADGQPFPFKPGQTWFEVIGASSKVELRDGGAWHFTHLMAP